MSWEYSENILVQNSAGKVLQDKLGWDVVFAYNTEVLGENGTLSRTNYKEIILTRYLKKALFDNNEWMTEEYANSAVKTLCAYTASATLMQINEEKYTLLRDGIPVQVKNNNGVMEERKAAVFNFTEPKLEKLAAKSTQQEAQELARKIAWMKETEMAVIVSQEQNEIQTFKNWGLDITFHRTKMEKREMDKEFKDSDNPFRIVFVCAMWLTGFDVKSLATVYIDKPLKAHTLK